MAMLRPSLIVGLSVGTVSGAALWILFVASLPVGVFAAGLLSLFLLLLSVGALAARVARASSLAEAMASGGIAGISVALAAFAIDGPLLIAAFLVIDPMLRMAAATPAIDGSALGDTSRSMGRTLRWASPLIGISTVLITGSVAASSAALVWAVTRLPRALARLPRAFARLDLPLIGSPTPAVLQPGALAGYREELMWTLDGRRLRYLAGITLVLSPLAWLPFGLLAAVTSGQSVAEVMVSTGQLATDLGVVALALAGLIVTVVGHEAIHGAAMRVFGAHPIFGLKGLLAAYASAPGYPFGRNQYVVVALAPLIALSLVGAVLIPVMPFPLREVLVFCLGINAAGASGDLVMTRVVLGYAASARIMDELEGLRIFVTDEATAAPALIAE